MDIAERCYNGTKRKNVDDLATSGDRGNIVLTIHITKAMLKAVEEEITINHMSRCEFVRRAIEYYITHQNSFIAFCKEKGFAYDQRMSIQAKVDKAKEEVEEYMEAHGYNNIERLEF